MDDQKNNIRVIFTTKANSALDLIIKNYNLEETPEEFLKKSKAGQPSNEVLIDRLAKDFSSGKISEKDIVQSLQKNAGISQQIAEKILKEILTDIIPFLEKVPEKKLQDSDFLDELDKRIFGETTRRTTGARAEIGEKKDMDIFPKIKPLENIAKPIGKNVQLPEEQGDKITTPQRRQIKKSVLPEELKQSATRTKQPKGSDNYREPIE